jgi:hypothetical protein
MDKEVQSHLAPQIYVLSFESSFCLLLIPATSLHVFKKASSNCTHSIKYELHLPTDYQ